MTAMTSIATGTTTRSTVSVVDVRGATMTTAASVPSSLPITGLVSDTAASQMDRFLQGTRHAVRGGAVFFGGAIVGVAVGRGVERNVGIDLTRPRLHHHNAVAQIRTLEHRMRDENDGDAGSPPQA